MIRHPLDSWLEEQRERRIDFAKRIGCSAAHLTMIMNGKRGVSLDLALSIERETAGAVTVSQLQRPAPAAEVTP